MAANRTLTPRQRAAVAALVSTPTAEGAAIAAGVARSTLYAWLEQPDFAAAVSQAQGAVLTEATRELSATLGAAVAVIRSIMECTDNPPTVRLRAAELIIDGMLRLRTAGEFERRLSELEAREGLTQ